jgi:hypothetical protein
LAGGDRTPCPPNLRIKNKEEIPLSDEDREVAREALEQLFGSGRAPGRRIHEVEVEMVTRCAAAVGGDRAVKLQSLRDAFTGARRVSKQPPTVRFVFGELRHFLRHAERGAGAPPRKQPPRPTADAQRLTAEQMRADIEKLFGAKPRTNDAAEK